MVKFGNKVAGFLSALGLFSFMAFRQAFGYLVSLYFVGKKIYLLVLPEKHF